MGTGIVMVVAICSIVPVHGGESAELHPRIAALSQTYETQLGRIRNDKIDSLLELQGQYLNSLVSIEMRLRQNGELDPLLALNREKERFEQERTVSSLDLVAGPEELASLQKKFMASMDSRNASEASKIKTLASQYEGSLMTLQQRLTEEGDLNGAIAAKKEREHVSMRPEVTASEFALAESSARSIREDAATRSTVRETEPVRQPSWVTGANDKKYTSSDRSRIEKRFKELCSLISDNNWDKTVDYIDPETVRDKGAKQVAPQLKLMSTIVRISEKRDMNLKAGAIEIDQDAGTAEVVPKVWRGSEWGDLDPTYWKLVDGDWYMSISGPQNREKPDKNRGILRRKGPRFRKR